MRFLSANALVLVGLCAGLSVVTAIPPADAAFSDGFKKTMTDVQAKIMLNNQKFTPAEVKTWWDAYDKEILALLNAKKPVVEELNAATGFVELAITEKRGTEVEDIELGKIGVQFYAVDPAAKLWLAVLNNRMYAGSTPLPFSTVRFYKDVDGKFERVAALDEISGPWDKDKLQFGSVQYQPMGKKKGAFQFSTFHIWPVKAGDKPNRSQIIWEYKDAPRALTIIPEVDWHTLSDGTVAQGHGEAYDVP